MKANMLENAAKVTRPWRMSDEAMLPVTLPGQAKKEKSYNIFPYHSLGPGKIFNGYTSLAKWIAAQRRVIIEGCHGVFWNDVRRALEQQFSLLQLSVSWTDIAGCLKPAGEIQSMVDPYLGEEGSVWGTRCRCELRDFFNTNHFSRPAADDQLDIHIIYGTGAALVGWKAPIVYLEVPKNEIQYRFRAGAVNNFACSLPYSQSEMYKRSYFVDWPVIAAHKQRILPEISVIADVQWRDDINWVFNRDLLDGLAKCSQSVFRARPWFEPGAWGGRWLQDRIKGLNKQEVNYAWSFELIVPENGLVFESDGYLLEVPFDQLMFIASDKVLGKHHEIFGNEFPIRFDFLDTFDGGNLSIQCHPSLSYIRERFGENITQDETYYILDCKPGARVYLGFQDDIDPRDFELALRQSQEKSEPIDIEKFVQCHPASRHDLFLIPNGTVHSAGVNNLVLEISATPYIFTFKMYDWMRLGLDGRPRPINIDHAFANLNFSRKGEMVKRELISTPVVIHSGNDWQLLHLPTHQHHFYDVHRIDFDTQVTIRTENACHILMLVENSEIMLQTADGTTVICHYAETYVVPAAATSYTLTNKGNGRAKVVKAFVKNDFDVLVRFKKIES